MHMIHKKFSTIEHDHTKDFNTQFTLLAYDKCFVDPQCGRNRYWDYDLYDQGKLENKSNHKKPTTNSKVMT